MINQPWQNDIHKYIDEMNISFDVQPKCKDCGSEFNLMWTSDPFSEEIHGDDTPQWQCKGCSLSSAMDI